MAHIRIRPIDRSPSIRVHAIAWVPALIWLALAYSAALAGPPDPNGDMALVWSQPPLEIDSHADPNIQRVFCGWDEPARSTHSTGGTRQWRMVVDDFPSTGSAPITHIRWWGCYKAWKQAEPPTLQPSAWHIGFWLNTRSDLSADQVYPERLVWGLEVSPDRVTSAPAGVNQFPQHVDATCYQYDLALDPNEWFRQADFSPRRGVFWISITAVYPTDAQPVNQWGWQTRPAPWRDGAQLPAIMGDWPTPDMPALFPGRIYPVTSSLLCGTEQPYDMAFELLTDSDSVAWNQPFEDLRTWPYAEDHLSYGVDNGLSVVMGQEVYDDWLAATTDPVVALAWYGSYPGYGYQPCACDNPSSPRRPDYFALTMLRSTPGFPTAPGGMIWQYLATDFDETLVGFDGHPSAEPNEAVFRYTVRIPQESRFQPSDVNAVYWLNIVAVYQDDGLQAVTTPWGWTSRPHTFGTPAQSMATRDDGWHVDSLSSPAGPVDMCLTLYTAPPAAQIGGLPGL
jgi:hypothetical protein